MVTRYQDLHDEGRWHTRTRNAVQVFPRVEEILFVWHPRSSGAQPREADPVTLLLAGGEHGPRRHVPSGDTPAHTAPRSTMTMSPRLRKFALAAHLTFSVGWIGTVGAYLGSVSPLSARMLRRCVPPGSRWSLTGWYVIVPLALASLVTG
jgi:hypothetical protein